MDGITTHDPQVEAPLISDAYRLHRRFDRMARLTSDPGMEALQNAFVIVIGLGGVGSFAAEALARSGVGRLRLIDFDDVCVTNANRQLHALKGNIGKPKATLVADRMRRINPVARIEPVKQFYQAECSDELLEGEPDFVVDAIDQFTAKCHLIATCTERGIPIITSMGAAGRWDPTRIQIADLNKTHHDPMAANARKILREKHAFPKGKRPWGVPAVFSDETYRAPYPLAYEKGGAFVCVCPQGQNGLLTCDGRARIDGSASFVTGAFGLAAASYVVRALTAPARASLDEAAAQSSTDPTPKEA